MAHMVSQFSVAALLSIWLLRFRAADAPALGWAALLGAAGRLVLLVRLQDAPFLLLPYLHLLVQFLRALRAGQAEGARRWLWSGLLTLALTIVVFLPQLVVWQRLYGAWTTIPYASDHDPAFFWLRP